MQYKHTQKAPLWWMLLVLAGVMAWAGWELRGNGSVAVVLWVAGGVVAGLGFCFRSLTVIDNGDRLAIRYGPLPVFRMSIPYAEMTQVEAGRSTLLDGWGIHYVPGRGWTYNLWGYDCVVIHRGQQIIRVGSDDVQNLIDFLTRKIS